MNESVLSDDRDDRLAILLSAIIVFICSIVEYHFWIFPYE